MKNRMRPRRVGVIMLVRGPCRVWTGLHRSTRTSDRGSDGCNINPSTSFGLTSALKKRVQRHGCLKVDGIPFKPVFHINFVVPS